MYVPSYLEVKRVYNVYQYIFSGVESMCWTCITYSLSKHHGEDLKMSGIKEDDYQTDNTQYPLERSRGPSKSITETQLYIYYNR